MILFTNFVLRGCPVISARGEGHRGPNINLRLFAEQVRSWVSYLRGGLKPRSLVNVLKCLLAVKALYLGRKIWGKCSSRSNNL